MAEGEADAGTEPLTVPAPPSLPPPSAFVSERTDKSSLVSSAADNDIPHHALAQASDKDDHAAASSSGSGSQPRRSDFDFFNFLRSSSAQAEDLARSVVETTDHAMQSARFQIGTISQASSDHLETAQGFLHTAGGYYKKYEDIFFNHVKDGIRVASDHPTVTGGVLSASALLLMRTPRRLLFRMTIGRFQSEEAMLTNAENKVKEMRQSVDLLKNEGRKLEERAKLAEEEYQRGRSKLKSTGGQLVSLVKNVYKTENGASGLMANLRELPGREAIKLRAEVAAMAAEAKEQRQQLNRTMTRIASHGIPV
eukprot:TRINITY_DN20906_c0_g1_i1.p1 TRINITY_DN20906_c0_g1~~TRINITY_DN20906_c0_g1_i1.p1  ORF type:complete len:310 (+),score=40.88 TRINITY_DN20906_c0_g1_i1:160-1089(+)